MGTATSRPVLACRGLSVAGALLLLLAGCGEPAEAGAIGAAAVAFVREHGGVPATAEVEEVAGDHARVLLTPVEKGSTEPAWVFLRREDGRWEGLAYGTAFGPETFEELGIPRSLRPR
jgi:hypothetical protein